MWTLPILFAAMSHAVWNLLVKQSPNKPAFLWWMRVFASVLFFPLVLYTGAGVNVSDMRVWVYGGGSVLAHSLFGWMLARAYETEDFSTAYPIARGTGPLFAAIAGWMLFAEPVTRGDLSGVAAIAAGLYVIHLPRMTETALLEPVRALRRNIWPLLVGCAVAAYTLVDKLAVGVVPPLLLNLGGNVGQMLFLLPGAVQTGSNLWVSLRREWHPTLAAGLLSAVSYTVILISLQHIPISETAPIRESSIVMGAILGAVVMREKFTVPRMLGSLLIVAGVLLIAVL